MVLPARGLADLSIGHLQAEKPMFGKEGVRPSDVVEGARDPRPAMLLAQDIAQPPSDPAVERREYRAMAMFEVFKPAAQREVEVGDGLGQAVSRCALGLCPDR